MIPGGLWVEDAGEGSPVVLLHPGIGDSRSWDLVMPLLTPSRRVIRYDARGYGRSPQPTSEYSLKDDLRAVLDHFGLERVVLAGCSMGGSTALSLALDEPDRVAALVLLCPGLPGLPAPEEPEVDAEWEAMIEARDEDGLLRFALGRWARSGADDLAVAQLKSAIPTWLAPDEYRRPDPPLLPRLGELRQRSVVMVGDRDQPMLAAAAGAIAVGAPDCRLVWMPGVDHLPALRVPELVAHTILEFSVVD